MIYLLRLLQVLGGGLALTCLFSLMVLMGRRGTPLIDAPEYIPVAIAFGLFGLGLFFMGGVMGSDLAPIGRRKQIPATPHTAKRSAIDPVDARMILDHMNGTARLAPDELSAAFGRTARAMDAAMSPEERARREQIAQLKLDNAPVRLKVMVPPGPSDSWVGGNPSMPADMPWPDVDGKPAMFYAQIAAHHLPPDVWGWHGPRNGWLLFFGPSDHTHGDAVVLHTTELGEERPRPFGQVFRYYRYGNYDENALKMMGDKGLQPPKWPVDIIPTDLDAAPAENESRNSDHAFDLSQKAFQPFDWPTLIALVAEIIAQVHFLQKMTRDVPGINGDGQAGQSLDELLPPLEDLAELLRRRSSQVPYSDDERDRILGVLGNLTYMWPTKMDGTNALKARSIIARVKQSNYPALHDTRAKHVYCDNPSSLPAVVRALLEPEWQAVAEDEVITMGGSGAKFGQDDVAVMIDLVPSRLFNWTFGDYSNFAIMVQPGDVLDSRWDKAFAMDNHGI